MNNENSRFDFALRKASYREIEACFREFNLAIRQKMIVWLP